MPDLIHSLILRDIGFLRIVASLWGIELTARETDAARVQLVDGISNVNLAREILEVLPAEAFAGLKALMAENGRISWVRFIRQHGEVREIGPGKRDRLRPHLQPISAAEALFYRALVGRAFFDTPGGLQEFAYIPDDLYALMREKVSIPDTEGETKHQDPDSPEPPGRPASPKERAHVIPASDRILDDLCTLLAALRLAIEPPVMDIPLSILLDLLSAADLIVDSSPQPESIRTFLGMPRREALDLLVTAWKGSDSFSELRQVPGLVCEGEWKTSSRRTRHLLLSLIDPVPKGKWWSLNAFILDMKEKHPDFQRPAGDYDSWFIRREADGQYLRGFSSWDSVDGALIRHLIGGVMHWLGLLDLAAPEESLPATAFRIREPDASLSPRETGRLHATSNGRICVPRLLPRAARYQIARFCEWEQSVKDEYRYRVTPASLTRARRARLRPEQLLALLHKHAAAPLPPPFVRAIQRWEINGTEARFEDLVVLRVGRPEVLDALRKSKAGRFLEEPLGPTAVIVKKGARDKVLQALAEMGLLAEYIE